MITINQIKSATDMIDVAIIFDYKKITNNEIQKLKGLCELMDNKRCSSMNFTDGDVMLVLNQNKTRGALTTICCDCYSRHKVPLKDFLNVEQKGTKDMNNKTENMSNGDVGKESKMQVIFNAPATIVIWKDKTKTVVKTSKDDTFNPEVGFLRAFFEKQSGMTKTKVRKFIESITADYYAVSDSTIDGKLDNEIVKHPPHSALYFVDGACKSSEQRRRLKYTCAICGKTGSKYADELFHDLVTLERFCSYKCWSKGQREYREYK